MRLNQNTSFNLRESFDSGKKSTIKVKAVKEQKRHLGQRKKQPLRIPTVNDRIVQMLHVITLSGKEILRVASTTVCHRNKLLPDTERVMKCLSGMKGNFHVPF